MGRQAPEVGVILPDVDTQLAQRLHDYQEAGADHVVVGLVEGDWRHQVELLAQARGLLR